MFDAIRRMVWALTVLINLFAAWMALKAALGIGTAGSGTQGGDGSGMAVFGAMMGGTVVVIYALGLSIIATATAFSIDHLLKPLAPRTPSTGTTPPTSNYA